SSDLSNLSHSIFFSDVDIKTPTMIKAGAVTSAVTTLNKGEKNKANKKSPAATTAVKPDRPPTPTPAVDSTYDVVVDVPTTEPTTVAVESASNALPARGSLLSFISPACVATATSVPAVSKKSTKRKVKIITSICKVNISPKFMNACPNVGAKLGTSPTIPPSPSGGVSNPIKIPAIAVKIIP